jgi:hypothetical protein
MKPAMLTAAALSLALWSAGGAPAQAAGCLKGALVGGVAGHYAGHHGVLGAIGGCVVGRHMANKKAAETPSSAQAPQSQEPAQKPN